MDKINEDVLTEIINFTNGVQDLNSLMLVSKQFSKICDQDFIWYSGTSSNMKSTRKQLITYGKNLSTVEDCWKHWHWSITIFDGEQELYQAVGPMIRSDPERFDDGQVEEFISMGITKHSEVITPFTNAQLETEVLQTYIDSSMFIPLQFRIEIINTKMNIKKVLLDDIIRYSDRVIGLNSRTTSLWCSGYTWGDSIDIDNYSMNVIIDFKMSLYNNQWRIKDPNMRLVIEDTTHNPYEDIQHEVVNPLYLDLGVFLGNWITMK